MQKNRCVPFEIKAIDEVKALEDGVRAFYELREIALNNGMSDMSLDEINEEISLTRVERKRE